MNRYLMSLKKNTLLCGLMIGLIMGLALTGCDDGDAYDAQLEEARMALDDGNYALARSILDSLPQTEEVMQYKSNAIAGGIGIDTFNIISTLEDLEDEDSTGSIDMVGRVIAGDDGQMTEQEIADKLAAANEAIELFLDIAAMKNDGSKAISDIPYLSDDQKMQLGLLGITRTVLTLADLICREILGAPVTMTEAWVRLHRGDFLPVNPTQDEIDRIEDDLLFISAAIDVFADTNDMKDDFQEFRDGLDADQDDQITAAELNAYLNNM